MVAFQQQQQQQRQQQQQQQQQQQPSTTASCTLFSTVWNQILASRSREEILST